MVPRSSEQNLEELKRRYHEDRQQWEAKEAELRERGEAALREATELRRELAQLRDRQAEEIEDNLMDALSIIERGFLWARWSREHWEALSKPERDVEPRSVRLWANPFVGEAVAELREALLALVESRSE